jgi:hypothetical protein
LLPFSVRQPTTRSGPPRSPDPQCVIREESGMIIARCVSLPNARLLPLRSPSR